MKDDFDSWLEGREKEPAIPEGELLRGTSVGECRIVTLLGRGGFAEVYRGEDADGKPVAIKMLHRLDVKARMRFELESRILLKVGGHPNLPQLVSFGSCGERPYMVMELLKGCELPNRDRKVAAFLQKVISAVQALHKHGYLHRDIKPQNILMRDDGEPVLVDFGLACPISKAERAKKAISVEGLNRIAVGTPGYSAPEQFSGQDAGVEADVHAIGVLMRKCFGEKMPKCWDDICMKATNSNPEVRYRTVEALGKAIDRRHWRGFLMLIGAGVVIAVTVALAWGHVAQLLKEKEVPHELPISHRI